MDWILEDNMVDGLFFCAALTGCRGGHTPFVQAGMMIGRITIVTLMIIQQPIALDQLCPTRSSHASQFRFWL